MPNLSPHILIRHALATCLCCAGIPLSAIAGGLPAHVPGRLALQLAQAPGPGALPLEVERWVAARGGTLVPHFPGQHGTPAWEKLGLWWLVDLPGRSVGELADSLEQLPGVVSTCPDWISHLSTAPDDPLFPQQWALDNSGQARDVAGQAVGTPGIDLGMLGAWELADESRPPVVAVLDTGVDPDHPEFHGRLLPGFNFLTNLPGAVDDNGHGTSVASLIAARTDNSEGLAGISKRANILPLKVFNSIGLGTASALANALNYALQTGCDVANFSGGLAQDYGPASAVIEAGRAEGRMWTVAAGGNDGLATLEFPARLPACVAVGALSPCGEVKTPQSCDGETWWASNTGAQLDLVAPGVRLVAATAGGGYRDDFNGSSAACAYVSGVLALMRVALPDLGLGVLENALYDTALDVATPGYDSSGGHGLPRVDRALLRLVPPQVEGLTIRLEGGAVRLAWTPLPAVERYRVEAADGLDQPFLAIATTTSASWRSDPRELSRPGRLYRVVAVLPASGTEAIR